jgi:acetylornithine deacetylase/succinyl-diaminopimelate desuccinylase-like protein
MNRPLSRGRASVPAVVLTITSMLLTCMSWAQVNDSIQKIRNYRQANEKKIVKEFMDLLAIPNVASDSANIRKNGDLIVEMLKRRGVEARLLEFKDTPPAVYGELKNPSAAKTIGIYVHYDGQPVDASQWKSEPWKPVLREGPIDSKTIDLNSVDGPLNPEWRLYARSAGDDKAPISAITTALDAMKVSGISPSVNVKFFFEGEEEAGSPHLPGLMEQYKDLLKADVWLLCDGPVHQSRKQQLFFGARGVMGVEMIVYGPTRALHSGHYGNWAPNPIAVLANLIASMRDMDGKILIPGFYDSVRPLTNSERKAIAEVPSVDDQMRSELGLAQTEAKNASLVERIVSLPALNLRGFQGGNVGEKAANAIPIEAHASIDFRLVPDEKPAKVRELTEQHIKQQGFHIVYEPPSLEIRKKFPRIIYLQWEEGYPAARTLIDLPESQAVIHAIEKPLGIQLIKMPSLGGSIPMYLFIDVLNAPVIGLPIANHDNNQHAANENLRLQNLWDGIQIYAALFSSLQL